MEQYLWLLPLGFVIGAYGTLIGAGGGFVLMPALLLLYPGENPEILTSISLAVVFVNTLSGSWAYARMRRIDYVSGLLFAAATIPGAILGSLSTASIPRLWFDVVLGSLMIASSVYLLLSHRRKDQNEPGNLNHSFRRHLVEADKTEHTFSYNPYLGISISFIVGYVSSLLGMGGGIIHVPALVNLLSFPIHVATATSHFMLAIMTLTGTIVHIATGTFTHGIRRTIVLAIGVFIGAQLGARLSSRVHGDWIMRALAVVLALVGVRVLIAALG